MADFELLFANCLAYNGPENSYTRTAQRLLDAARSSVCSADYAAQFEQVEQQIDQKPLSSSNLDSTAASANPTQLMPTRIGYLNIFLYAYRFN